MGSEHPHATNRVGTLAEPHAVMAALLAEIENGGFATPDWPPFRAPTLGVADITVSRFYELLKILHERRPNPSLGEPGRVLDTGVEAQIHGPVMLDRDVETLVADPAFAHTGVGQSLVELADKYGFDCAAVAVCSAPLPRNGPLTTGWACSSGSRTNRPGPLPVNSLTSRAESRARGSIRIARLRLHLIPEDFFSARDAMIGAEN
jgi:hypothetical protein